MEQYLRRKRLSSVMDELGLRALIALGSVMWFVRLWGLGMPALLAGLALGLMGQMALTRWRRRAVERREQALRCRLGGEMLLEDMLLQPPRRAHFQAAMLLGQRYPIRLERVTEDGMLCQSGGERLLVACLRKPPEREATPEDLLASQRACKAHGVSRCVLCLTCRCSAEARAWAETSAVPVRIISRDTMLALAGQASPATDAQLISLGKRRNRPVPGGSVLRTILDRGKAGRYMFYGTAMVLLYVVTGLKWYPLPGLALVLLAVTSRYLAREDGPL
ncbi:MAG: hypothetical protein ACI4O7_05720 [Aristaeellaceae bacterium]